MIDFKRTFSVDGCECSLEEVPSRRVLTDHSVSVVYHQNCISRASGDERKYREIRDELLAEREVAGELESFEDRCAEVGKMLGDVVHGFLGVFGTQAACEVACELEELVRSRLLRVPKEAVA